MLLQKGGFWITADVYVKRPKNLRANLPQSKSEAAFFEQHNIEENKFESYDEAKRFFEEQGFELVKEAVPDYQSLSVLPQLMRVLPEEARNGERTATENTGHLDVKSNLKAHAKKRKAAQMLRQICSVDLQQSTFALYL